MASLKLPEFDHRNLLNTVKENFEKVGRKSYAIRMIYAGEHGMEKTAFAHETMKTVNWVNGGYADIPVKGILLVYDSYFVHVIEGSEETLYRQLRFMFDNEIKWEKKMRQRDQDEAEAEIEAAKALALEEERPYVPPEPKELPERIMFRRLKMLMVYHSITTLLFNTWIVHYGRPPSLVGKLDIYAPIEEHMEQLHVCIEKIQKLIELSNAEGSALSFVGISANDPRMEALPETALLDYLLNSKYIYDLREVTSFHRRVDDHIFYFEQVWPLPMAYTPQHLYKLKVDDCFVDPLPVMPWEMKTEDEDEDRESKQSTDSD